MKPYQDGPNRWQGHTGSAGGCSQGCDGRCGFDNGCQCKDCYYRTYPKDVSSVEKKQEEDLQAATAAFSLTFSVDNLMDDIKAKVAMEEKEAEKKKADQLAREKVLEDAAFERIRSAKNSRTKVERVNENANGGCT